MAAVVDVYGAFTIEEYNLSCRSNIGLYPNTIRENPSALRLRKCVFKFLVCQLALGGEMGADLSPRTQLAVYDQRAAVKLHQGIT